MQPTITFLAQGTTPLAMPMPRTAPYISVLVDQWLQFSVARDPSFDSFTLDPERPGAFRPRISDASWDSLTALERWREGGTAPSAEIVADTAGVPGRTRPLCDYPKWPRYRGSGDVNAAASFTCIESM